DASVLGYSQLMNPGGYELEANPSYQSVADLEKAIQAGIRTLPAFQAKAMDEVAKADLNHIRQKLDELMHITHVGDVKVFGFLGEQMRRGPDHANACLFFLQNHADPACHELLKKLFEKTKDLSLLHTVGRQGAPAARAYLEKLALKNADAE